MKFFVEVFGWDAIFSKIVTTVFLVMFSYFSQKHFTFKLEDGTELID
jgi:putative flippase GtrA